MAFESIRIQNFKGFIDAEMELLPLTVILGPNSAGKSSFGQALVALSKSHIRDRNRPLNLMFDQDSSVELGGYSDLVHAGCEGQPVKIGLGLKSWKLKLGFNRGNPRLKINELDLMHIEIYGDDNIFNIEIIDDVSSPDATSKIVEASLPESSDEENSATIVFHRETEKNWTIKAKSESLQDEQYKLLFDGLNIDGLYRLTGTEIDFNEIAFTIPLKDAARLLEKVVYLRPDRVAPLRKYENAFSSAGPEIDDWGNGTAWYLHEYGDVLYVDTFDFPHPTSDVREAEETIGQIILSKKKSRRLSEAVTGWLNHLGLADSFETNLIDSGRNINLLVSPQGQTDSRSLTDVGYGVSQVLPIIVKGLSVEEGGLFIVEQPEAQLHPRPQAELADFFCSMVKCGRNILVETHSEALFHRIRILSALDDELSNKIAIYFIDEPSSEDGVVRCSQPRKIPLTPGSEFEWPTGFLSDGVETEMQVRAARLAKKKRDDKN